VLTPFEIHTPGSQNLLPEDKWLHLKDLQIKVDPNTDQLMLWHTDQGKRVWILDQGFEGAFFRSQTFQFLNYFSPPCPPQIVELTEALGKGSQTTVDGIVIQPRIVFEDHLVLQRKHWQILQSLLPFQQKTESDPDYFRRLQQWRAILGLPRFAFFSTSKQADDVRFPNYGLGKHDYKPQFMDFENPLSLQHFAKQCKKVPEAMRIEEMLPEPEQLMTFNGEQHVSELFLEWSFQ
jgi:hypothetical protein